MHSFLNFFSGQFKKIFDFSNLTYSWKLYFVTPVTTIFEEYVKIHNQIIILEIIIFVSILWIFFYILYCYVTTFKNKYNVFYTRKTSKQSTQVEKLIEFLWTIFPAVVLIIIGRISILVIYSSEEIVDPSLTIKIIGHQWYWSYEYNDNCKLIKYDSYLITEEDLVEGELRLLEVNNRLVLPCKTYIRLLITSNDVIHSFCIPSLGIKLDAIPGRLNQILIYILKEGVYFGQCSELCGINHGYMPIVLDAKSFKDFTSWWLYQNLINLDVNVT